MSFPVFCPANSNKRFVQIGLNQDTVTTNSKATLTINTGTGNDRVEVYQGGLTANGLVQFNAPLRIDSGDGNDNVFLGALEQATILTVNTGRGNDQIHIQQSTATFQKFSVWAGEGDDRLSLLKVTSLTTIFGGGNGTDTLETYQDHPNDLGDATITGFEVLKDNPSRR